MAARYGGNDRATLIEVRATRGSSGRPLSTAAAALGLLLWVELG
jgi:hypothetical protein